MEITKSQKRLFIILGLVLLYAIFDFISNKDTYSKFYSGEEKKAVNVASLKDSTVKIQNKTNKSYLTEWGEDPFYIPEIMKITKRRRHKIYTPKLQLFAISYKGDQSAALINDKFLRAGDLIEGFYLKKIEKNRVLLSDGKKTIILTLVKYLRRE